MRGANTKAANTCLDKEVLHRYKLTDFNETWFFLKITMTDFSCWFRETTVFSKSTVRNYMEKRGLYGKQLPVMKSHHKEFLISSHHHEITRIMTDHHQ